jgi:pimeloyl-ACP methyl ester carboxylesterase
LPPKPTATATPDPAGAILEALGYVPIFESSRCSFEYPRTGYQVECGHLIVPEDRSRPDGATVRLHVAVFRSTNPDPAPDPVIHLFGGGGANMLEFAEYLLAAFGDDILENRDLIMYNQRGTLYGDPMLQCFGYTELLWELARQPLSVKERDALEIEFLLACRDKLLDKGVDLSMYNTNANAADVRDLKIVLGYDQVNLYGSSYGSRLALEVMRDYPEGIRSVILDSVLPPQVDYHTSYAHNAYWAVQAVFEACAADTYCSESYPDLEATFYQVVDELNANPIMFSFNEGTVIVDGRDLIKVIYDMIYYTYGIPLIPAAIYQARAGDYDLLKEWAAVSDQSYISWGTHYSMLCHDIAAWDSYEEMVASAADLPPQVRDAYVSSFIFDLCASWPSGQVDSREKAPVVSNIPTVVLAGQYDPITPPFWSKLTSDTLSNSFYYELPGLAHSVTRQNDCALEIALAFLDDPTAPPDAPCIDQFPGLMFR